MREVVIRRDDAGQRLDRFLRKLLPGSPLGNLFKLVRKGLVRVNGKRAEAELRLAEGDRVEIRIADESLREFAGPGAASPGTARGPARPPAPAVPSRRAASLKVLHRDEHVLAIDKPPHLLVQPGEGGDGPTLDVLVRELAGPSESLTFEPGLAHRLDRGTSGIVLFGLSAAGLRGLTEAFRSRGVEKTYLALVEGSPAEDAFVVDLPLARDPSDDSRGAKVKVSRGAGAQEARTDFRVVARSADGALTLLEAHPRTGRTHQIRAHLRAVRLPIAGDPTYGDPRSREKWGRAKLRRQFLHAWKIRMPHPVETEATLEIESRLPPDLVAVLKRYGMPDPSALRGGPPDSPN